MDALMLDGNAIAGLLQEAFGAEMTEATGTCDACGASQQVGAVHVFRSAGVVLRCHACGSILAKIVVRRTQTCVDLRGLRSLAARAD
jgi:hypothetical protein